MKVATWWHLPLGPATAYSWRGDPDVPAFMDTDPIIVFDGVCVLCSGFVHWVIRRDRNKRFRFVSAQSLLGRAIYRHIGLPTEVFETNLLISDGYIYGKSEAFFRIVERLGPPWLLLAMGRICPQQLRTWLYDRIARNRYSLFGRTESCMIPTPDIAGRFLA